MSEVCVQFVLLTKKKVRAVSVARQHPPPSPVPGLCLPRAVPLADCGQEAPPTIEVFPPLPSPAPERGGCLEAKHQLLAPLLCKKSGSLVTHSKIPAMMSEMRLSGRQHVFHGTSAPCVSVQQCGQRVKPRPGNRVTGAPWRVLEPVLVLNGLQLRPLRHRR